MKANSFLLRHTVHHLASVRTTSKPLLSAIIWVAARFWFPEIATSCFDHLEHVLSRAIFAGQTDLELIQALLLSTFWRKPGDKSNWIKTGMAIRMAQVLNLHLSFSDSFIEDHEADTRQLLVGIHEDVASKLALNDTSNRSRTCNGHGYVSQVPCFDLERFSSYSITGITCMSIVGRE